jgi:hypothetical protein
MSEMSDKLAMALDAQLRSIGAGYTNIDLGPSLARVALEVLREPTDAMKAVDAPDMPAGGSAEEIWQSMIDEALK